MVYDELIIEQIENNSKGIKRYICCFSVFLTIKEFYNNEFSKEEQYKLSIKRAKNIGGKKYHSKYRDFKFRYCIVFNCYDIKFLETQIIKLLKII